MSAKIASALPAVMQDMEHEDWLIPKCFHTVMKGPDRWAVVHPVAIEVSEPLALSWFDSKQEAQAFCDNQTREWKEWADNRPEEEGING